MTALAGVFLSGGMSFVPGQVRPVTKNIVHKHVTAQASTPQGSWAMGLPAVAVLGLVTLNSTRKVSGLTRKTRICRQAAEEGKEVAVATGAKEAVAKKAKKAKPVPVCGSEWVNEVNPELSHPSGLYILPVEPAEPKGAYDYDNDYNQVPSETSVHAQESKWVPQCTPK